MVEYKCKDCDYTTNRKLNYDRHVKTHTKTSKQTSKEKLFKCAACNKWFSSYEALQSHIKTDYHKNFIFSLMSCSSISEVTNNGLNSMNLSDRWSGTLMSTSANP